MDTATWIFLGFVGFFCLLGLPFFASWALEIGKDFQNAWVRAWLEVLNKLRREGN